MTQRQKLIRKLQEGRAVTFDELMQLLVFLGFQVIPEGSHFNFRKAGKRLTLPRHGKEIKRGYRKQILEVLQDEL